MSDSVSIWLSIVYSLYFLFLPNSTNHLYIRIGRTEALNLDKINMVIFLPLAMLWNARDWRLYVLFKMQHCNGRLIEYQSISIIWFIVKHFHIHVFILIFIFIHIHSYSPKGDKFTHPMLIAFLLTIFNPKVFWSLVMRLGS